MAICAFFGHSDMYYYDYEDKIRSIIIDLIENHGIKVFYNGYRGNFDRKCADIVGKLKQNYPYISNILVLSYHPDHNFYMPRSFDDSVYLLDRPVPPRYAIARTNRIIAEKADFIVSGVKFEYGGAYEACRYARRLNKKIISIFGENLFKG